jgi:hypothetical protein
MIAPTIIDRALVFLRILPYLALFADMVESWSASYPEAIGDIVLGGFTIFAGGVMTLML